MEHKNDTKSLTSLLMILQLIMLTSSCTKAHEKFKNLCNKTYDNDNTKIKKETIQRDENQY